jgi:hypothetical protein
VTAVGGRVTRVDARADNRGLMAHHIDSLEQRRQRARVADVDAVHPGRQFGVGAVRGGKHRVDGDDLVVGIGQRGGDPRPDEPGSAGQQNSHGRSKGNSTPSCGRQWVQEDT